MLSNGGSCTDMDHCVAVIQVSVEIYYSADSCRRDTIQTVQEFNKLRASDPQCDHNHSDFI